MVSYIQIAEAFRDYYRRSYMEQTLDLSYEEIQDNQKKLVFGLRNAIPSEYECYFKDSDHLERIRSSFVVVYFFKMENSQIWGQNFARAPFNDGSQWAMIFANTELYVPFTVSRRTAQKIKAIMAHEWLEALYSLVNYDEINLDGRRSIAGKAEMYALLTVLEGENPPWVDGLTHHNRLIGAWEDLLVSHASIERLCREDPDLETLDELRAKYLKLLHADEELDEPNRAANFLAKVAIKFSGKLNVAFGLVLRRLKEALF